MMMSKTRGRPIGTRAAAPLKGSLPWRVVEYLASDSSRTLQDAVEFFKVTRQRVRIIVDRWGRDRTYDDCAMTDSESDVFSYLWESMRVYGCIPLLSEVAKGLNLSSQAVEYTINSLDRKGWINRHGGGNAIQILRNVQGVSVKLVYVEDTNES
jgi:hypothetical protein